MDKVNDIVQSLNDTTYVEKKDVYSYSFSLGTFSSDNVNDKLILISLVSLMYIKLRAKNRNITPLDILLKITKQEADDSGYYQMLENLAIMVEELSYECKKADSCGLKSSEEIINKIKEILSAWIPF